MARSGPCRRRAFGSYRRTERVRAQPHGEAPKGVMQNYRCRGQTNFPVRRRTPLVKNFTPTVSIIIPCRNERHHIEACLSSVLAQDEPDGGFEVIVADGMSDDGTREVLARLAAEESRLRVIDNPGKIVSTGLNAAIEAARGSVIVRVDGHAEIASDFLRQNLALLQEHPEAWSVGGP